jgi:hypothetical protein
MNITIVKKIGIIVMLFILVLPNFSSQKQASEKDFFRYDHLMNYPIPKSNSKWFLFSNINTTGFVNKADYVLNNNCVRIFYFNSSHNDFGQIFINGLINNFSSNHVYSMFLFGFNGETSWNGMIKEDDIWLDGFSIAILIRY